MDVNMIMNLICVFTPEPRISGLLIKFFSARNKALIQIFFAYF